MAGARLGYAFASPAVIADLEKIKYSTNPYNVNRLTLLLGAATVDAEDYYREKCREIVETRTWTAKQLEKLGFFVLPSDTNFLFAKTGKMDGGQLYETLRSKGILVRHFNNLKIGQYNRITIGTREQMEVLINTLKEVLL
jgi:histidinol-phosphate aminotransferase